MNTTRHPAHWSVVLDNALRDPGCRKAIKEATGYDDQKIDQIAAGNHGIHIDKIGPFLAACGITFVRTEIFDAYVTMAIVGAECMAKNQLWRRV